MAAFVIATLAGCASPGPPLPPSLKLPEVVGPHGLTATRFGNRVRLQWTTPSRTTDKLPIKDSVTAEICRNAITTASAKLGPCTVVLRVPATAGASEGIDPLTAPLTTGPPRLLAYRIQLLNSAGRTAGPSEPVYAAAGAAPEPVENLHAKPTKSGTLLEWKPAATSTDAVVLDRMLLDPTPMPPANPSRPGLSRSNSASLEVHLRAGAAAEPGTPASPIPDPGGTIDRTVEFGHTYRYTAERLRTVNLGGVSVDLHSEPSPPVTVAVRDVFPPESPTGLLAAPGFAGEQSTQRPAIDLSWDPNMEARIAGYRVYRRDLQDQNDWRRIGPDVAVAAYRDTDVIAGHKYGYRVTAINAAGAESPPSASVEEAAPSP